MKTPLKSDRQSVERAIGLKRMKWCRLKYLDVFKLMNALTMLMIAQLNRERETIDIFLVVAHIEPILDV